MRAPTSAKQRYSTSKRGAAAIGSSILTLGELPTALLSLIRSPLPLQTVETFLVREPWSPVQSQKHKAWTRCQMPSSRSFGLKYPNKATSDAMLYTRFSEDTPLCAES